MELTRIGISNRRGVAEVAAPATSSHLMVIVIVGIGSQINQIVLYITRLSWLYGSAVCHTRTTSPIQALL